MKLIYTGVNGAMGFHVGRQYTLVESKIAPFGMSQHLWVKIGKNWIPYKSVELFLKNWKPLGEQNELF